MTEISRGLRRMRSRRFVVALANATCQLCHCVRPVHVTRPLVHKTTQASRAFCKSRFLIIKRVALILHFLQPTRTSRAKTEASERAAPRSQLVYISQCKKCVCARELSTKHPKEKSRSIYLPNTRISGSEVLRVRRSDGGCGGEHCTTLHSLPSLPPLPALPSLALHSPVLACSFLSLRRRSHLRCARATVVAQRPEKNETVPRVKF